MVGLVANVHDGSFRRGVADADDVGSGLLEPQIRSDGRLAPGIEPHGPRVDRLAVPGDREVESAGVVVPVAYVHRNLDGFAGRHLGPVDGDPGHPRRRWLAHLDPEARAADRDDVLSRRLEGVFEG